jgi:hypothetical protein
MPAIRLIPNLALAAGLAAAVLAPTEARAVIVDPLGDFLAVYTGPQNGDLDVVAVDAVLSGPNTVVLVGTHAAPIGTTQGAAYVWGVDRGAGTELLTLATPSTGAGITFDAVAILFADGTGFVLDLILGGAPLPLGASDILISDATISVSLSQSILPSQGLAFADYRYNLWPRFAPGGVNPADNTQISDLAPDASTFVAQVPEPAGLALLATGMLGLAALGRRHRAQGGR